MRSSIDIVLSFRFSDIRIGGLKLVSRACVGVGWIYYFWVGALAEDTDSWVRGVVVRCYVKVVFV